LFIQAPNKIDDSVDTVANQRGKTLAGKVLNAIRPWQPYKYFATNEWLEQDYVNMHVYPSGFTPWTDILSVVGYSAGIVPFIAGLADGAYDPEPIDKKFYKILGESARGAYIYPRARAEEELNYLKTLGDIEDIENSLEEKHPVIESKDLIISYKDLLETSKIMDTYAGIDPVDPDSLTYKAYERAKGEISHILMV
jgi:hypothetical protein